MSALASTRNDEYDSCADVTGKMPTPCQHCRFGLRRNRQIDRLRHRKRSFPEYHCSTLARFLPFALVVPKFAQLRSRIGASGGHWLIDPSMPFRGLVESTKNPPHWFIGRIRGGEQRGKDSMVSGTIACRSVMSISIIPSLVPRKTQ